MALIGGHDSVIGVRRRIEDLIELIYRLALSVGVYPVTDLTRLRLVCATLLGS